MMFRSLIVAAALAASVPAWAQQDTYVRGYTTQNGTYVQPHHRTNPDNTLLNNYSTQPNVNPYTGQQGTVNPNAQPNHYGTNNFGAGRRW